MKKVLSIYASPNRFGTSSEISEAFESGLLLNEQSFSIERFFLFEDESSITGKLLNADVLVFSFPVWSEFPPYKLIELFQSNFVERIAYSYDDDRNKISNLNAESIVCLITQGRDEATDTTNLRNMFINVGVDPHILTFTGINNRVTDEKISSYKKYASEQGKNYI